MKYSEWKSLDADERKNISWHRRPHIRTATLFTIAFGVAFIIIVLGISKNSTVHINRKPTKTEAYSIAKTFVKDKLKQPEKAVFANKADQWVTDTATDTYNVGAWVKIENDSGKLERSAWEVKMKYIDGDWAEKSSWQVISITVTPQP
jgi:Na+-transporting NADH:ubiquinone oxidoreductase subunit NqrF